MLMCINMRGPGFSSSPGWQIASHTRNCGKIIWLPTYAIYIYC
nr:MAG TPA: hypothetical protein [Caudoviricetes sp.]